MKRNQKSEKIEKRFLTGSDLLDIVIGGGIGKGYPAGRIINIVGDKSSGKTFLACELIANAYYKYGKKFKWIYDDCESGFTFDTLKLYGIEIIPKSDDKKIKSNTVEELYCNYRRFLESIKKDEVGIYVIDSLDGLSSNEILNRSNERYKKWEDDKEFKKGSYQMGAAKFFSQEFFRGLAGSSHDKNVLLCIISQVRCNIDPMNFKKFTRSGGKALDHYCNTVLWLANMKKIKRRDRIIGIIIKAKLDKSKTPRPYRECVFPVLFDYGIDNIGANIDYLFDLRTKTGELSTDANKIVWKGEKITASILKDFIKEKNIGEEWKEYKKENGTGKKEDMINFLKTHKKCNKDFVKRFGESKTKEELINWIESEKMENELKKRVRIKWEAIEEDIKIKRLRKYNKVY